jgi:hypothetical protein
MKSTEFWNLKPFSPVEIPLVFSWNLTTLLQNVDKLLRDCTASRHSLRRKSLKSNFAKLSPTSAAWQDPNGRAICTKVSSTGVFIIIPLFFCRCLTSYSSQFIYNSSTIFCSFLQLQTNLRVISEIIFVVQEILDILRKPKVQCHLDKSPQLSLILNIFTSIGD